MTHTAFLATALLAGTLLVASAAAQPPMHGQDSEFGSIRTPYSTEVDGERTPVQANVVLKNNYEQKDAQFYLFAFSLANAPQLDVVFEHLVRADTGDEMPCMKTERDANGFRCFVDLKNMPEAGTEIALQGTVGANRVGSFQLGVSIIAFTYLWEKVNQDNGLPAELYGYTLVNVRQPTSADTSSRLPSGMGNAVPGVGALGAGAALLTAFVLSRRRHA